MNVLERVFARAAKRQSVQPGEFVKLEPDWVLGYKDSFLYAMESFQKEGFEQVIKPERIRLALDLHSPDTFILSFCRRYGIRPCALQEDPLKFIRDQGQQKMSGLFIAGGGWEVCQYGAYGAAAILIPPQKMGNLLGVGSLEMNIPEMFFIELSASSKQRQSLAAWAEQITHQFGVDGLSGLGVILGGSAFKSMNWEDMKAIIRLLYEVGAVVAVVSPQGPMGQVEKVIKMK
ncbi:hypothetical protein [Ammoniphilus resinae]|uniref:Homoaconitase/3-isopropylmalate dehydratase large subunit n=1 Tax=Ammoniphilus resinae TaxID=861532 RepID=A0ABS4GR22_9BACL|nr:hypothetical protein [Ammoniphilus resinae]MBP1932714.1 homoaconitase/3-isopropylmalate dehydratase large subunit [Ammoniphilus resinae]